MKLSCLPSCFVFLGHQSWGQYFWYPDFSVLLFYCVLWGLFVYLFWGVLLLLALVFFSFSIFRFYSHACDFSVSRWPLNLKQKEGQRCQLGVPVFIRKAKAFLASRLNPALVPTGRDCWEDRAPCVDSMMAELSFLSY